MGKQATKPAAKSDASLVSHRVVSREQWIAERKKLLQREKELTRLGDQIASERRALPRVRIDKAYTFDTLAGPRTLSELFEGRSQLLVQHFMLAPGWEEGCPSCSFMADHTDGMLVHLAARDTSFAAVSLAPLAEIEAYRKRMGWRFAWVSSNGTDFNHDFRVTFTPEEVASGKIDYNFGEWSLVSDEWPGVSAFYRNGKGEVFHTYSAFGRGVEVMMGTYRMLDLTAKGRDEDKLDYTMAWVRRHDSYDPKSMAASASCCGHG